LEKGVPVDVKDKFDETPLHHAAARNKVYSAEWLLKNNANINLQNKFGETPLIKSSALGHLNVVTLLLQYNAKTDIIADGLGTAKDVALHNNRILLSTLMSVMLDNFLWTTK
jgi:ankyrin repeat protein